LTKSSAHQIRTETIPGAFALQGGSQHSQTAVCILYVRTRTERRHHVKFEYGASVGEANFENTG